MQQRSIIYILLSVSFISVILLSACSTKKNTAVTRAYHSLNTRYNVYFNANEAYKEALDAKIKSYDDNLSELIYIFPYNPEVSEKMLNENDFLNFYDEKNSSYGKGLFSTISSSLFEGGKTQNTNTTNSPSPSGFTTTIDKCTKAIKLHSIKTKPVRDKDKMKYPEYQVWIQQKEFNPFMKNVWLLLGKAEMQDGNYLRAISTFMYTTKMYSKNKDILAECKLWIARSYTEMGWLDEAEITLRRLDADGSVPDNLSGLYASVYANFLMRGQKFKEAIPYLQTAIRSEKNKIQKTRMKYMLGQVYEKIGDNEAAYKAYGDVSGISVQKKYIINAKIAQLAINNRLPKKDVISKLMKLTKKSQYTDYLDKLYYTIGNIYVSQLDTVSAIKNYRLAIEKSKSGGYDKMLASTQLGNLYFERKDFVNAQPYYSTVLQSIKKTDKNYNEIALRSAVLDELVIHIKTVKEQDSLQYIASLPESERLQIINREIEQLKKDEKKRQKEQAYPQQEKQENKITSWDDLKSEPLFENKTPYRPQSPYTLQQNLDNAKFYFYNPQTVEQGKIAFQRYWGARKLEDNWRRKNKMTPEIGDVYEDNSLIDNRNENTRFIGEVDGNRDVIDNIYSPEYYLQQLPLTKAAISASNDLIENALFSMGGIYQYKLEDLSLAAKMYESDVKRFPKSPNKEEIYYQLFLIAMQQDDRSKMLFYRSKLLSEYAGNSYAIMLSEPNYEWNLRNMQYLQDSIYETTYDAYVDSDIKVVRENYQSMQKRYPLSSLMPKFMMLNALTYAQTRDANNLKSNLHKLVSKYPDADVTPMAKDILSHLRDGQVLLSDGTPIRGMMWSLKETTESNQNIIEVDSLQFAENIDSPFLLLLFYKSDVVDRNKLLYQVADYNFSNYLVQTFDLSFEEDNPLEILQIKGFSKYSNIRSYLNKAFQPGGLMERIDPSILIVPVSEENTQLFFRKGIDEYIRFYKEHYTNQTPQLVAYWQGELAMDINVEKPVLPDSLNTESHKELEAIDVQQPFLQKTKEQNIQSQIVRNKESEDKTTEKKDNHTKQVDIVSSVEKVVNNPVDGLKSLFSKYKSKEKLTKDEKEQLKQEQRIFREHEKQIKIIEKARQDSIKAIEKARVDALKQVERERMEAQKRKEDERTRILQEKKDAAKTKEKAREDVIRQKEANRKAKRKIQEEQRKEKVKEREQRRKIKDKERKEKEKNANKN